MKVPYVPPPPSPTKQVKHEISPYGDSLASLWDWARDVGADPRAVRIEVEYGYYDSQSWHLVATVPDPEYPALLAEHEKWMADNHDRLEAERREWASATPQQQLNAVKSHAWRTFGWLSPVICWPPDAHERLRAEIDQS